MEFSRREPNPAQLQVINRLVGEGFIPPIEPTFPIEELIENNIQTVYTLHSIADYCQRQLTRGDDYEGFMLTELQASEIIVYQRKVLSEIQRLHGIEERLMLTDSILRLTEGETGPVSAQVMIEGSVLLNEDERVLLRDVLVSEPVGFELAPTFDLNFASELLRYQTEAQRREAVEFGPQTRLELADILTSAFGNEYEAIEGFRDLCAIARNIYIRRENPAEAQLIPLLVGPFRQAARSLGVSDSVIQNTLAQLNLDAAEAAIASVEAASGQVDTDSFVAQVEDYLAEVASDDDETYQVTEAERAYEAYKAAARLEYLVRFRGFGLIPCDSNGNELSHEESNRLFYEATNTHEMSRMEYVAAGVAWHSMGAYGNAALQMYSESEIAARRTRYERAAERERAAAQELAALQRAQEIYYFIDKFVFLDAGTGISESFQFRDANPESVSYDCREVLDLILEAPDFSDTEIRQLYDYFTERYEGHYSLVDDIEEMERRRQVMQDESVRSQEINRLKLERRNIIDTIIAATHHDRFSSHDDWRLFVRRLHQFGDIVTLGAPANIIDDMWQEINELASRIGIEQSELQRIHDRLTNIE